MTTERAPVPYSPQVEDIAPDEQETVREFVETFQKIGTKTFEDYGRGMRTVHAKCHGLLVGELRVYSGLAPELAQGLFAKPATYPVVIRISTSPGDPIHDKVSLPRGFAIKIIGVDGERFDAGTQGATQDFVMGNGPVFLKGDPKAFLRNLKLLAATTDKAEGAKQVLSKVLRGTEKVLEAVGGESKNLKALGGHPATHPLGDTYFTGGALRYGDYMAKLSLAPSSPELRALTDAPVDIDDNEHALRDATREFFAANGGEWELRAQLCTDLEELPIEDASKEWKEDVSPFRPVAQLVVPAQPAWIEGESEALDRRLSFNPWHALLAHQPLGAIMRARRVAYQAMSEFRAAQNGVGIVEPTRIEDLGLAATPASEEATDPFVRR